LTEAAVIEAVVQHHSLTGIRVDQVMITPVITLQATEYEDAAATLTFMQQQQIQILPVVNEQGSVLGVFTQERIQQVLLAALKAENSNLQESEFTIKQFLEHSPDFIYINEVATGNQVYSNLACPALYQTRREDYNHQVWLSQIHPDDRQRIETQHLQELEKKQYIEAEYRIVRPDKSERWIWDRRFPIYNRVGEITRYASINRDVTEQKQLEENLKNTLISAIAAIISFRIFADRSIQYDYFSSGCEGIYGYSPEELLSDHNLWRSCLFEGDFESIILPRHQDYFSEQISVVEFRFCHKDGSIRWIYSKAISRRDHRNDCWVVTVIDTDITELKQTQLQLKEQESSYRALVENSQDIIARFDR
jgi:PAS domain S-box-containing protein